MKKVLLAVSLLLISLISAKADFSAILDAGRLRLSAASPMPFVGTSSPYTNGSLLLLIAAGGDSTFSNVLNAGQYVSGNDIVLAAGGFNNGGGPEETLTSFVVNTTSLSLPANDQIALRWFPQITYATYLNNPSVPATTAGQNFGTYSPPSGGNPDGGSNWRVPASGQINLNFFTTDSAGGGTQLPSAGYASFTVVPEPSTNVIVGVLAVLGAVAYSRKRISA